MNRFLLLALALLLVPFAHAQERANTLPRASSNAAVMQTVGITDVTVTYGRPAARERTLFGAEGSGALETYGAVWRLGANEATTITVSTDVMVEGQALPAGTYALFAVPNPTEWAFIFNRQANQWGSFNRDEAMDVLRVATTPTTGEHIEQLSIWFEDVTVESAKLVVAWGTVRAAFTITTDTDMLVAAAADAAYGAATDWRVPYNYANYGFTRGMDPVSPLRWIEQAVTLNNAYATVALKARLQAASGDFDSAVATGEAAVALAEAMEEKPGNLAALREALGQWRERMN